MTYSAMYEMWRVDEEGVAVDVLLDLGHAESCPLRQLPWFFGVRMPMTRHGDDGMPEAEEEHRLNLVENRIREALKARDGRYVGRRTGGGNRDLVFYLPERPRGVEDRLRASVGSEMLFVSRGDPKWEAYQAMLPTPRDWRQIEDRRIIGALLDLDANPEAVHAVQHAVETSLDQGAQALLKLFEKLELEECEVEGVSPQITVTGVQRTPLDPILILPVSWVLETKAPQARGVYMGWIAEPRSLVEDDSMDDLPDLTPQDELTAILESLAGSVD